LGDFWDFFMFFFMFLVLYSPVAKTSQVPWGTFLSTSPVPKMASLQWTRKGMRKLTGKLGPSGPQSLADAEVHWSLIQLSLQPSSTFPIFAAHWSFDSDFHCFSAKSSSDARLYIEVEWLYIYIDVFI
jgi:hypothetical protein